MAKAELSPTQRAQIEAAKERRRQETGSRPPEQRFGCVLVATLVLIMPFLIIAIWMNSGKPEPEPVTRPRVSSSRFSSVPRPRTSTPRARSTPKVQNTGKAGALGHCKGSVKERLKAPRTAKFKGMFDDPIRDVTDLGSGRFRVKSWVDSQNSFGAMIRNQFECTVDFKQGTVRVSFD